MHSPKKPVMVLLAYFSALHGNAVGAHGRFWSLGNSITAFASFQKKHGMTTAVQRQGAIIPGFARSSVSSSCCGHRRLVVWKDQPQRFGQRLLHSWGMGNGGRCRFRPRLTGGVSSMRLALGNLDDDLLAELYDDDDGMATRSMSTASEGGGGGPYKKKKKSPPKKKKVQEEEWIVPESVEIPPQEVEMAFARSGGAGGQNVNKVNTKVELRFLVLEAEWLPLEVRQRLKEQQANRMSKDGYLVVTSQEHRTQARNRQAAFEKLEEMALQAWPRPKVRKMRTGVSKAAKERNKEDKRRKSAVKESRKRVTDW